MAGAEGLEEVLASAAAFFIFNEAESVKFPDSEISPISSVSGRLSEDWTTSNCKQTTLLKKRRT